MGRPGVSSRDMRQADEQHAAADPGDAEDGCERELFVVDRAAADAEYQRDEQRPEATHDGVGEAKVAVLVGAGEGDVVADVDHERSRQPRPRGRSRQADREQ